MKRWFRVQSIGTLHRPHDPGDGSTDFFDPGIPSMITIDDRWLEGLLGIEDYSHLVVLFYLDRATRRRTAGRTAAGESRFGLPPVGFFGTRTPKRPNPIGISCPALLRREGADLHVQGIDAWDGTPILDIKGYSPRDEYRPGATVPRWLNDLWVAHDAEQRSDFRPWE